MSLKNICVYFVISSFRT